MNGWDCTPWARLWRAWRVWRGPGDRDPRPPHPNHTPTVEVGGEGCMIETVHGWVRVVVKDPDYQ